MNPVETLGGAWDALERLPETVDAIEPTRFEEADLRAYYEEVEETANSEAGSAMLRELALVHHAVTACGTESVLLIHSR